MSVEIGRNYLVGSRLHYDKEELFYSAREQTKRVWPDIPVYLSELEILWRGRKWMGLKRILSSVDAVGVLAHWGVDHPRIEDISVFLDECQGLGLPVYIEHLTIAESEYFAPKHLHSLLWNEVLMKRYSELFELFERRSDVVKRVTLGGLHDGCSWHRQHLPYAWPHLWDEVLEAKPVVYSLLALAKRLKEERVKFVSLLVKD